MKCKYWDKHLDTIVEYAKCLYRIDGSSTGGLLHIVLDDSNYTDYDLKWTIKLCDAHPECEESVIGKLICKELLKLSDIRRALFDNLFSGIWTSECTDWNGCQNCDECPMITCEH